MIMQMPGDPGCTCYRLRKAARVASRVYDRHLAPAGINIGQFGVLLTIESMQAASISKVADVLDMERTTLTRNLMPLERSGYVVIGPGRDKRSRAVRLTAAGAKLISMARPLWRSAQDEMDTTLGTVVKDKLHALLDRTLTIR
jgi:DNA-binding MarR family transcriptional regulator